MDDFHIGHFHIVEEARLRVTKKALQKVVFVRSAAHRQTHQDSDWVFPPGVEHSGTIDHPSGLA